MYKIEDLQDAIKVVTADIENVIDPVLTPGPGLESRLIEAMRYSFLSGGKRLRPLLVKASAQIFGADPVHATRVGAAVECAHCMSLIHDDLPAMDDDDLRRGMPTCHKEFDEATAILAGDAMILISIEILLDPRTHPDSAIRLTLMDRALKSAGHQGMVGGQMIDMLAEDRDLTKEEIYRLQQMKTGALIDFSAVAGGIIGGASDAEIHALERYAHDMGIAFQIADDLLDVESTSEELGKTAGKDVEAGKATIVNLLGIEEARREAHRLSSQAIEHLSIFDEKADLLRAIAHFAVHRRN